MNDMHIDTCTVRNEQDNTGVLGTITPYAPVADGFGQKLDRTGTCQPFLISLAAAQVLALAAISRAATGQPASNQQQKQPRSITTFSVEGGRVLYGQYIHDSGLRKPCPQHAYME